MACRFINMQKKVKNIGKDKYVGKYKRLLTFEE